MTRLNRLTVFCLCVTLLSLAAPTFAQEFRGRINGVVTDNTGAILPGVTVTASSPAMIQPQVQVTGADGSYRFLALNPGLYQIEFDLTGFQKVDRKEVRVVINQTLTIDQQLNIATLQETVTVTGASPVVDTSTTAMGTNFTKELLTEIPNARDIWAAMGQAPGIQMTAYDVGGSNTGNQSGFRSYGFDTQNQTRMEGIDTTEGTAANAGYFDFGSFEEFQVGGAGADSGAFAGGAVLSISVKSGGDQFRGESLPAPDEVLLCGGNGGALQEFLRPPDLRFAEQPGVLHHGQARRVPGRVGARLVIAIGRDQRAFPAQIESGDEFDVVLRACEAADHGLQQGRG